MMETAHRLPRFFVVVAALVWVAATRVGFAFAEILWWGDPPAPMAGSSDWVGAYLLYLGVTQIVYLALGLGAQSLLMRRAGLQVGLWWLGGALLGGVAAGALGEVVGLVFASFSLPAVLGLLPHSDLSDARLRFLLRLTSLFGALLGLTAFAVGFAFVQGRLLRSIAGDDIARMWTRSMLRAWLGSAVVTAAFTALRLPSLGLALLIPGLVTGLALKRIVESAPAPPEDVGAPPEMPSASGPVQ